jgi:hypothetical protein
VLSSGTYVRVQSTSAAVSLPRSPRGSNLHVWARNTIKAQSPKHVNTSARRDECSRGTKHSDVSTSSLNPALHERTATRRILGPSSGSNSPDMTLTLGSKAVANETRGLDCLQTLYEARINCGVAAHISTPRIDKTRDKSKHRGCTPLNLQCLGWDLSLIVEAHGTWPHVHWLYPPGTLIKTTARKIPPGYLRL